MCDSSQDPETSRSRLTDQLVEWLADADPEYRFTSHIAPNDNRYVMVEFPAGDEYEERAAGEFIELVETFSGESADVDGTCENCGETGETYARLTIMHSEETPIDAQPVELCESCRDAFDLARQLER